MSGHTPGPWEAGESSANLLASFGVVATVRARAGTADARLIADVFGEKDRADWVPPLEAEANARLIAAAPDLLQLAEAASAWREAEANNDGKPIDSDENAAYTAAWVVLCDLVDRFDAARSDR